MTREYRLIRSPRRTVELEISPEGELLVRAPLKLPRNRIDEIVQRHASWIERKRRETACRPAPAAPTEEEFSALIAAARAALLPRVAAWSAAMGLEPSGVRITRARTRWGSCSAKNSLCFSCHLMRRSPAEIDYVIVHELAHIVEKNHSKRFYALVARYLPEYKSRVQSLKSPI